MLATAQPEKNTFNNLIIWCTIYTFFLHILTGTYFAYANRPIPPPAQASTGSVFKSLMGLIVPEAYAYTDTVRTTVSADEQVSDTSDPSNGTSDGTYVRALVGGGGSVSIGGGSGSVNSVMGAYGHSYPIQVPPGRGGLQPALALTYSSMAGNGWLGLGWDIAVGSIQRSTKDGRPGYTDDDTFVITLKGTSIALVEEAVGEYRLKDEGLFLKILKQGDSWLATDKGGTRYYFGSTVGSQLFSPDGIFKWCLDRMEDANGNAVDFYYNTDSTNSQIYPAGISYDVDNHIVFESDTETRPDTAAGYAHYFMQKTAQRLKRIKVYHGDPADSANLVRGYELSYTQNPDTRQTRLTAITQYDRYGEHLPSTTFDYTTAASHLNSPFDHAYGEAWPSWGENFWTGDFTGDGKTDFMVTPGSYGSGNGWTIYESNGERFDTLASGSDFGKYTKVITADFNGDGFTDIITYRRDSGDYLILRLSNGAGFDAPINVGIIAEREKEAQWSHVYYPQFYVGDFNGDGKADLIKIFNHFSDRSDQFEFYETGHSIYLCNGEGFSLATSYSITYTNASLPPYYPIDQISRPVVLGDYNGDGKTDIMARDDTFPRGGERRVFTLDGSSLKQLFKNSGAYETDVVYTGDFNGDGKTDLLTTWDRDNYSTSHSAYYSGHKIYLSTGDGFVLTKHGSWPSWGENFYPGDYNGDGRTDMLVTANRSLGVPWTGYRLYTSTGRDLVEATADISLSNSERYHMGDFDGDGRQDFLISADKAYDDWAGFKLYRAMVDTSQTVPQDPGNSNLIGTITNMLGATTTIEYTPSSVWPRDVDDDGDDKCMPMVLPTVTAMTISPESGKSTTNTFAYQGGLYNIKEKEFRGFAKVAATDQTTGIQSESYHLQEARFQGRVYLSRTRDINGNLTLEATNNWDAFVYDANSEVTGETNERTFAFVDSGTTTRYDESGNPMAVITADYEYDEFGNMTVEDKEVANLVTGETSTRFTRTVYANDKTAWILGMPTSIRIAETDPGPAGTPALRETNMTYFPDRPWLRSQNDMIYYDENRARQSSTTHHDYDIYGNITWTSNPRNPSWGVSIDYSESNGMFPNLITNALGQTSHRVYDPATGQVTRETDANGQITTYTYDSFGRPDLVAYPDGSVTDYSYNIVPGNHWISAASTKMPTATAYYDNLDRKYKEEITDSEGNIITTLTDYDDAGRIAKQSLPYYTGDPVMWTINSYDVRGRIKTVTHPDATVRTIDYNGFEQTLTDENGHVKKITKDSLGRLVKVEEINATETGITTYQYDLFDNLIYINGPLGNETHITYDGLGRKTGMDDPYMGHWQYDYDAAGNLTRQIDGKNRESVMAYDELNRLDLKDDQATGRQVDYVYDEARSGYYNLDALTSVITAEPGDLPNTVELNYDQMGRTATDTRIINGVRYTTDRQYDLAGRLENIVYPDQATELNYTYYPMGYLKTVEKIAPDGTVSELVRYEGHNAMGQISSAIYGNGAVTTYTYYQGNQRLRTLKTDAYTGSGDWGQIQDIEYAFDHVGNVQGISDHLNNAAYTFGYDHLDRLTSATAACSTDSDRTYNQAYTYDLAGNMVSKTGKGGFEVTAWQDTQKHLRPTTVLYAPGTTGAGQRQVTYNQDNMPTTMTYNGQTSDLFYDGQGSRIKKVSNGRTTIYVAGLMEIDNGETLIHIFADSKRIATIKGGQPYYTHSDHLGSTSLVTNATGQLVEEIGYLPFGATLFRKVFNNSLWESTYRFTGQEYDEEYELYNYNARLYDPTLGRFITPDSVVPDWTNPQSLNRYAYCMNNPLKYVDPSGHFPLLVAVLVGALIGAIVGGISAAVNGGDVWQGVLQGAISGALSGAMFYCAPAIGGALHATEAAEMAAVHAMIGAVSGAVNAAITGGDQLQGAIIGAFSAGIAKCSSISSFSGRTALGAVTGGAASMMYGGDFFEGAFQGAWTSAIGLMCNEVAHALEYVSYNGRPDLPVEPVNLWVKIAIFIYAPGKWLGSVYRAYKLYNAPKRVASFADEEKLLSHFEKHGVEFGAKSADDYLRVGHDIMEQGTKVNYLYKGETRTGFVQFMGNTSKGNAKFGFVGTNAEGKITTIHVESGKSFWKMLNGTPEKVINWVR